MNKVTMYKTFDGKLHESHKDATRHIEKVYGDVLLTISRHLVPLSYADTAEYINNHLHDFEYLIQIEQDLTLLTDDEEEG